MRGAVLYGPGDVRFEERPDPKIIEPTDAILKLSATCVCGSDLWPYRGVDTSEQPMPMGHEYCGIVEEVGSAVRNIKPGQFVVGSFFASDNTCPICQAGYQSRSTDARLIGMEGAQAPFLRVPRADGTLVATPEIPDDELISAVLETVARKHSSTNVSEPRTEAVQALATPPVAALLPIMGVVFVAYLTIGIAMPVLPLHVHQGLGLSTFIVGIVAGSQFAAALLSRMWAGYFADSRGSKQAVVIGLLIAIASGLLYLLSLRYNHMPGTSVAILLLGRALLGAAESFIITGALSWGLALLGPQNTGTVMSWVGTALYGAFAVGAPAGTVLYAGHGFIAIALAATIIPLVTLLLVAPLRAVPASHKERPAFTKVIAAVWVPGLGLALSGVGFGAITTFVALLFAQHGWGQAWLAFTLLGVAFMVGRLVFGHLPDKIGGANVALACVLIEAIAQALIWLAPSSLLVLAGVTLTGFGYSLVYPGFGVEAVRRVPPESRGLAMGAFTAFLDLSLGLSSPALGLVASGAGLSAVFLASALVVLCSAALAVRLLKSPTVTA